MATQLKKIYSDIDLTFLPNPLTGDVSMSYDEQSVVRSVRNLLLTNFYERPFQPKLGSNLNAFLFENSSILMADAIEADITNTITNFEPRVTLYQVNVTPSDDENGYYVTLTFYVGNNTNTSTVNVLLQRDR
jgi:phage baseplate assembly protein W